MAPERTFPTREKRQLWPQEREDWYDAEGHYLEVIFEQKEGYFRETSSGQVMEKVDADGNLLGFSVFKVSALKERPLEVTL